MYNISAFGNIKCESQDVNNFCNAAGASFSNPLVSKCNFSSCASSLRNLESSTKHINNSSCSQTFSNRGVDCYNEDSYDYCWVLDTDTVQTESNQPVKIVKENHGVCKQSDYSNRNVPVPSKSYGYNNVESVNRCFGTSSETNVSSVNSGSNVPVPVSTSGVTDGFQFVTIKDEPLDDVNYCYNESVSRYTTPSCDGGNFPSCAANTYIKTEIEDDNFPHHNYAIILPDGTSNMTHSAPEASNSCRLDDYFEQFVLASSLFCSRENDSRTARLKKLPNSRTAHPHEFRRSQSPVTSSSNRFVLILILY